MRLRPAHPLSAPTDSQKGTIEHTFVLCRRGDTNPKYTRSLGPSVRSCQTCDPRVMRPPSRRNVDAGRRRLLSATLVAHGRPLRPLVCLCAVPYVCHARVEAIRTRRGSPPTSTEAAGDDDGRMMQMRMRRLRTCGWRVRSSGGEEPAAPSQSASTNASAAVELGLSLSQERLAEAAGLH